MDFSFLDEELEESSAPLQQIGSGYRNIWVVAEAAGHALVPASLEAMGQARDLADQIGCYVFAVLLGDDLEALGEELAGYGAERVLLAEDPALAEYQAETWAHVLAGLVNEMRPEIVLMPATSLGNDLAPRLAQKLGTGLISHCVALEVDMTERLLLGTYGVLGGEVFHTLTCPEARPQMATLQPGAFRKPRAGGVRGEIQKVDVDLEGVGARLVREGAVPAVDLPPVPLSKARIVVSAGRGMQDSAGFAMVTRLAEALGGVVAGSRGALDAGWIDEEQVIGAGGLSVAPDLYIACGVSGDVYHYFGVQGAKFIVAINSDPVAPIMKVAHMAVVGDARQVIPAMLEAMA
ncbi:MAG TPA: electron transfer flavoprotein subunit alpha/FixB family protein [Anaerolineae bacterium]|nr:electron transfer flavoprotein subunit alpha/FixB family protein [Anaerolineae bacterium]